MNDLTLESLAKRVEALEKVFATKEPETLEWIDRIPEKSVLWDIGANVGLYSCYAAKARGCRVFAFEPSVFNLEILARNIFLNQLTDQITIVPGEFASADANTSDNAPLGAISSQQIFQQVFSSAILTNLSIGELITGIGFRVEGNESDLPAQTISEYDISLSQSPNAPGDLSATFADNRGADFTTVRSGPLTINAGDFPGGSSPNNFGWISFCRYHPHVI